MAPRDLDPAKLLQVGGQPLRVEQDELSGTQMLYERYKRNFGRIGDAMKHRFTKKRTADCNSIKAAGECALFPNLDRMGVTEFM